MTDRYVITDAGQIVEQIRKEIPDYVFNPSLLLRRKMELLEAATFGEIDIMDATSPFMHLATSGAIIGSGILSEMEVINRNTYAASAQRLQEILPHMSDKDFSDLFATPDQAKFVFIFSRQELIDNMVADPETGIRKIVLPRNTQVRALDTYYSFEYPLEIRQMNHKGIQVVWSMDKPAPFAEIESNQVEYYTVIDPDTRTELLLLLVPLKQFTIRTLTETINEATETTVTATFVDKFCLARVYLQRDDGSWFEIDTTHADRAYPVNRPTAIVRVIDNICRVQIPQIYVNAGLISTGGQIRVDIYQTKGPQNQVLGSYDRTNFTVEWIAIDAADKSVYQSMLPTLSIAQAYSEETSYGGREALSFEQILERVTSNAIGAPTLPITPKQLASSLTTNGYAVTQRMDTLTKRTYLASRAFPRPEESELITAANGGIHTLVSSFANMVSNPGVIDNNKSITLTPQVLYQTTGTATNIVNASEQAILNALTRDKFAQAISLGDYYYSPFHYVLDNSGSDLECRAYHLDKPAITLRSFVKENDTTLLQVGIGVVDALRTETGFAVRVQTSSSEEWRALLDEEVFVQIAFAPDSSGKMTYLNGVLQGKTDSGERVYSFAIDTTFNINAQNRIELTTFQMTNASQQLHFADLETYFSVIFSTSAVMPSGHKINDVDDVLGVHILPEGVSGINHEKIRFRFGYNLKNLWSKCRTSVEGNLYELYEFDVPKRYTEDVFGPLEIVDGELVQEKLHSKGDEYKDSNGNVILAHEKNDPVIIDGEPVIRKTRDTLHIVDLMLIEGVYRFADSSPSVAYREEIIDKTVNQIIRDLASIQKRTLEETEVFFHPVHSTGAINIIYGEGLRTTISAGQAFTIRLFVTDQIYRNAEIRATLERKTVETLESELAKRTVSVSNITDSLKDAYGTDVISFEVPRLGGPAQLSLLSILDEGRTLSLRKVLQLRNDDVLAVKEDVTVEFRRHQL